MDEPNYHDLADPPATTAGRLDLMADIVAAVDGLEADAGDDDLDLWWGNVELDRLASGLTIANIAVLSGPSEDDAGGPLLVKSDPGGDGPTTLTPEGREAVRRVLAARPDSPAS